VEWLKNEGLPLYHGYAFASLRQCGASFELGALYLRWLEEHGETGLGHAAEELESISSSAKALILKTARAVNTKKPVDFAPILDGMAASWDKAMGVLVARYR
jgi:hypothetical protein